MFCTSHLWLVKFPHLHHSALLPLKEVSKSNFNATVAKIMIALASQTLETSKSRMQLGRFLLLFFLRQLILSHNKTIMLADFVLLRSFCTHI